VDAVEYLIVGGHAVAFHGYPRVTGGIHVFVRATSESARRVLRRAHLREESIGWRVVASSTTPGDRLGRPTKRPPSRTR